MLESTLQVGRRDRDRPLIAESLEGRYCLSGVPSLDTSFNHTGAVLATFAGGVYARATDAQEQADGKIIVAGQGVPANGNHQEVFVARYNADGSPDNSFNTSAKSNYRFYDPFSGSNDSVNGILQLGDGSFLVSGSNGNISTTLGLQGFLLKFTAAGTIDTSFGKGGIYTDAVQSIGGVAVQGADILLGGVDSAHHFALARLTSAGKLDQAFGSAGRVSFSNAAGSPSTHASSGGVSVRADQSIVYSGIVSDTNRSGLVANFTASGKAAAAFGSSTGQILINYSGDDPARAALRPDGGLLVSDAQFHGRTSVTFYVGAISASGVKSAPIAVATQSLPSSTLPYASDANVTQSNGQVLLAPFTAGGDNGGILNSAGYRSLLARTNAALGGLDSGFGTSGAFDLTTTAVGKLFASSAFITSTGKLLIAGFAQVGSTVDSVMLARFNLSTGTGNVAGSVYEDKNFNAKLDAGEALANVPVYVDLKNGGKYVSGDPITTTDVYGHYAITGLAAGSYTVRVDASLLTNLGVVTPASGAYAVSVASGGTVTGRDFALGAAGVAVYHGSTAVVNGDATPSATEGTDFGTPKVGAAAVSETFTIRNPGGKPLSVSKLAVPAGFKVTASPAAIVAAGGSTSFTVQLLTSAAGTFAGDVTFADNAAATTYKFRVNGTVAAATSNTASIAGTVFNDANANSKLDATELGLGLWQVYVDANKDGKFDAGDVSVTTDADGLWSFTGLSAGSYVVRVLQRAKTATTTPAGGALTVTLAAGQRLANELFGEKRIA